MKNIPRTLSLEKLLRFCHGLDGGFVFLKGRRRVGKTWILQELEKNLGPDDSFRLLCRKHTRDYTFLREVIVAWAQRTGRSHLTKIRTMDLTWPMFFNDVAGHAEASFRTTGKPYVFIIDEIQWLSTSFEDSAGLLKAAWDEWAKGGWIRVIASGSSARFFTEQVGDESVLRGIQTHGDISILPFSLATIKHHIVPHWTPKEAALAYMCLGGIPHYWKQVAAEKGFRRAMNDAFCKNTTIFLQEWSEILSTEFRTDAVKRLERIFPILMAVEEGVTQTEIANGLQLDVATIDRFLEKLLKYSYVRQCPLHRIDKAVDPKNSRGSRYVLTDFFLNFYFAVLRPLQRDIEQNESDLIFPLRVLQGSDRAYIPAFTGKAFERLVLFHIDVALRRKEISLKEGADEPMQNLKKKLDLPDNNYDVEWNLLVRCESSGAIQSQIDVVIVHEGEKSVRVIECKWKGVGETQDLDDVKSKILPQRYAGYTRHNFLVVSYELTGQMDKKSRLDQVTIITINDFL